MPKNQPTLFGDSDGPLTLAAVSFGVATILLTALLTWVCFRIKLEGHGSFEVKHWITLAVIFISYGVFIRCIPKAHAGLIASQPQPTDRNYNQIMYGRCLVGLGYFLLLYALLNLVAFAGFAASGHLNSLFPTGKGIENLLDDHPDSTIWSKMVARNSCNE